MDKYTTDTDSDNSDTAGETDTAGGSYERNSTRLCQDGYYGNAGEEDASFNPEFCSTKMDEFEGKSFDDSSNDGDGSSVEKESEVPGGGDRPMFSQGSRESSPSEAENAAKKMKQEQSEEKVKRQKLEDGYLEKRATSVFNGADRAQRMMQKMGYKEGTGLGKNNQGRLEPVEPSKQHGRRGLGHHIPGLDTAGLRWNPDEEEVKAVEDMDWLVNQNDRPLTSKEMEDWIKRGPSKETIDDETTFCSSQILSDIIHSKTIFDEMDKLEMRRARTRSNPYETIRGAFFLNRAAVKMANMDRACNFMFTSPEGLQSNELLYFADVCAGPGGFSEYVLWRKKWHAKGFGFTLRDQNDFKLTDFYAGPSETFHPFYGPKGDGNVFDPSNQQAFRDLVMSHTNQTGVHFMMSDGGFSVEGQENIQEILSKQLYLCQCIVALMIVRTGGHFVTKLFDLFTPFSAGLVYLMYRCFDEVSIFKPNTSRPANSERYLICKKKRRDTEDVLDHLLRVNRILLKKDKSNDVRELVPLDELFREKRLVDYLKASNETLGRKQIIGLLKIAAFYKDPTLVEPKQGKMRKQCLDYWKVPDEPRTKPRCVDPQTRVQELLGLTGFLSKLSTFLELIEENIESTILKEPFNWYCVPCGVPEETGHPTFFLGMGKQKVYRYGGGTWRVLEKMELELPPNTFVWGEIVYERTGEHRNQQKMYALHILDAYFLGDEDVSLRPLQERHRLIKKFCNALWKPSESGYIRVRPKELYPVRPNLGDRLRVEERKIKNGPVCQTYRLPRTPFDCDTTDSNDSLYYVAHSVLFLKSTAFAWSRHFSRTHKQIYLFNRQTGDNKFERDSPASANASFVESFENRIVWQWPSSHPTLDMDLFLHYVTKKFKDLSIPEDYLNI